MKQQLLFTMSELTKIVMGSNDELVSLINLGIRLNRDASGLEAKAKSLNIEIVKDSGEKTIDKSELRKLLNQLKKRANIKPETQATIDNILEELPVSEKEEAEEVAEKIVSLEVMVLDTETGDSGWTQQLDSLYTEEEDKTLLKPIKGVTKEMVGLKADQERQSYSDMEKALKIDIPKEWGHSNLSLPLEGTIDDTIFEDVKSMDSEKVQENSEELIILNDKITELQDELDSACEAVKELENHSDNRMDKIQGNALTNSFKIVEYKKEILDFLEEREQSFLELLNGQNEFFQNTVTDVKSLDSDMIETIEHQGKLIVGLEELKEDFQNYKEQYKIENPQFTFMAKPMGLITHVIDSLSAFFQFSNFLFIPLMILLWFQSSHLANVFIRFGSSNEEMYCWVAAFSIEIFALIFTMNSKNSYTNKQMIIKFSWIQFFVNLIYFQVWDSFKFGTELANGSYAFTEGYTATLLPFLGSVEYGIFKLITEIVLSLIIPFALYLYSDLYLNKNK